MISNDNYFRIWYSLVFGGIFMITSIFNYHYPEFIPSIAYQSSFAIWIGGLAVTFLFEDKLELKGIR